jgi:hypothetical protein
VYRQPGTARCHLMLAEHRDSPEVAVCPECFGVPDCTAPAIIRIEEEFGALTQPSPTMRISTESGPHGILPYPIDYSCRITAWAGSQSAPIGTLPPTQICETAQYLEPVYGWGSASVPKHRLRRISPAVVALVNSGEGLLARPMAGAQPDQRELVFMPVIAKPPAQVLDHAAEL